MPVAAAIGAAGALIGNFAGSYHNEQMVEQTNANNRALIERQNQMNIEQWQRENVYNHPVNQMLRLRAAGINPGIMYGSGGVMNSSAPSPAMQSSRDVPPQSTFQIDPLTAAQIANIEADTDQKRSQIDLNNSQVRVNDDSIEVGRLRLEFDRSLNDAQIGYLSKQCEDIEHQWVKLDAEIEAVRSHISLEGEQITAQRLENYFNSTTMAARIDIVFEDLEQKQTQNKISKEQFRELCEMFVINKQIAGEQLSQLIEQGKFDAKMRPYELLEQQNSAWLSGKELETANFNINLAKEKHGRHTVVGRYIDDVLGSIGQVLGGTASYQVNNNPKPRKSVIKKVK